jgi:hypothetical protein
MRDRYSTIKRPRPCVYKTSSRALTQEPPSSCFRWRRRLRYHIDTLLLVSVQRQESDLAISTKACRLQCFLFRTPVSPLNFTPACACCLSCLLACLVRRAPCAAIIVPLACTHAQTDARHTQWLSPPSAFLAGILKMGSSQYIPSDMPPVMIDGPKALDVLNVPITG